VFLRPALLALAGLLAPASAAIPATIAAPAPAAAPVSALSPADVTSSARAMGPASLTDVSGQGWAGYLAHGTRFRYVQAEFKLTRLDCAKTPGTRSNQAQMADWVGIDGWPSKTVEQDGVGGFCTYGVPSYSAWWETYPKPPHFLFNVSAGDEFLTSVFYSRGKYQLSLTDLTSGQSFSVSERCGASHCDNNSAEVITEDPGKLTKTYQDYPLADCRTTEFWDIKVTDQGGQKGNFDSSAWQDYQFTMTDKAKTTMMTVGSLFANGSAFQTFWKREY
jgi:hypothetical protein